MTAKSKMFVFRPKLVIAFISLSLPLLQQGAGAADAARLRRGTASLLAALDRRAADVEAQQQRGQAAAPPPPSPAPPLDL